MAGKLDALLADLDAKAAAEQAERQRQWDAVVAAGECPTCRADLVHARVGLSACPQAPPPYDDDSAARESSNGGISPNEA
jgi:hypothetical protein